MQSHVQPLQTKSPRVSRDQTKSSKHPQVPDLPVTYGKSEIVSNVERVIDAENRAADDLFQNNEYRRLNDMMNSTRRPSAGSSQSSQPQYPWPGSSIEDVSYVVTAASSRGAKRQSAEADHNASRVRTNLNQTEESKESPQPSRHFPRITNATKKAVPYYETERLQQQFKRDTGAEESEDELAEPARQVDLHDTPTDNSIPQTGFRLQRSATTQGPILSKTVRDKKLKDGIPLYSFQQGTYVRGPGRTICLEFDSSFPDSGAAEICTDDTRHDIHLLDYEDGLYSPSSYRMLLLSSQTKEIANQSWIHLQFLRSSHLESCLIELSKIGLFPRPISA